jgi:hypothetical protein
VYIGALMEDDGKNWFTVNVNAFLPPPSDEFPIAPADYDGEDLTTRMARRKHRWTPVSAIDIPGT